MSFFKIVIFFFYRQKVTSLREELEKEEFYVEYLENLLADVEKQKTRAAGDGEAAGEDDLNIKDNLDKQTELTEIPNKFSKSCSQNSIDLCINELADSAPVKEKTSSFLPSGTERSFSVEDAKQSGDESEKRNLDCRQRSLTQPNLLNFITVIEISGKKKMDMPLKCPPKPPPKTFMRPIPDGNIKPIDSNSLENENSKKRIGPTLPSPELSQIDKESVEKSQKNEAKISDEDKSDNEDSTGKSGESSYGKITKNLLHKTEDETLNSNGLTR